MQELTSKSKNRLFIISVVIYVLTFIMFSRLFVLQLIKGKSYLRQSERNKTQVIKIPAYRSIIFDRTKKNKLAYNRKSLSVVVIPANLPVDPIEKEKTLSNASALLNIPLDDLKITIEEQAIDKYTPVILKYDISPPTLVKFVEHNELYPGLIWENRPRRVYPLREKASQLIGYTGIINKSELVRLRSHREYHSGTVLGKMGIEKYYDESIRGKEGVLERLVDAKRNVLDKTITMDPVPGNPLVLAIHKELQELAYDLLGERQGAVVISRPATGEIMTLVSAPGFDPNVFTDRFSEEDFFVLRNNIDKPFLNRAIQGTYPPSSIFKLVTASAALHHGVPISKTVNCPGYLKVGRRVFKCWNIHHKVNMISAIANSCDTYFYTIGLSIGRDEIIKYADAYGINKRTKVDLPSETYGLYPEMKWFKKRYKRPWSGGDTANISIGQGDLLATPIGINVLTMAIVNEGIIYKPYILKEVLSIIDRKPIWQKKPEILRKINLAPEHFQTLKRAMRGVTTYGTAAWVQNLTPVPFAGKTGTGQAGKTKEDHALFTCYAPYNYKDLEEVIVVTVVVEHGGGGSVAAAPIAAKLIDHYFREIKGIKYKIKRRPRVKKVEATNQ